MTLMHVVFVVGMIAVTSPIWLPFVADVWWHSD